MSSHTQKTLDAIVNLARVIGIDPRQFHSDMSFGHMMSILVANMKPLATPTCPPILRFPNELLSEIAANCSESKRPVAYYGLDKTGEHAALVAEAGESKTSGGIRALSLVNKRFRDAAIPVLFRRMRITCYDNRLMVKLVAIANNPAILKAVRHLEVRVFTLEPAYLSPPGLDVGVPTMLASVIGKMSLLEELQLQLISFNGLSVPFFKQLIAQSADMSRVTTLHIGSDAPLHLIADAFPNVKVLSCNVYMPLSKIEGFEDCLNKLPLSRLRLFREISAWNIPELREVASALRNHPTLEHLEIQKELAFIKVSDALSALSSMRKLKELVFTCQHFGRRIPTRLWEHPANNLHLATLLFPNLRAVFFTRRNTGYRCGLARLDAGPVKWIGINFIHPVPAQAPEYWRVVVPAHTIDWAVTPASNWVKIKIVEVQTAEGLTIEGQTAQIETVEDENAGDQNADDQTGDEQIAGDQTDEDQAAQNQATGGQTASDEVADDEATSDEPTEDQAAEDQSAEDQAAESQTAEDQTAQ
ncbi:F-box domain-containing protein [Colletotrichum musicola]|uniref:F-box domain-containing protein n=1 Tax=Colletotrichum musicola TaxID=2175873 RepID=A0A8H6K7Q7_9PEZI|nr:F-box domain-containing protein [Colletotrichum musicola]